MSKKEYNIYGDVIDPPYDKKVNRNNNNTIQTALNLIFFMMFSFVMMNIAVGFLVHFGVLPQ